MAVNRLVVSTFCVLASHAIALGQSLSHDTTTNAVSSAQLKLGRVSRVLSPHGSTASFVQGACSQPAENCQVGDPDVALGSNRGFDVVADDFVASGSSASSICWWGAYVINGLDCVNPGVGDSFEIRYYEDDAGLPKLPAIAAFFQTGASPPLSVAGPQATSGSIADDFQEYVLSATHAPVSLIVGKRYWVEISNSVVGCEWFWETAAQGNLHAVQDGTGSRPVNGYDESDIVTQDLAFCLDIPLERVPNDDCVDADVITGSGVFAFDNFAASTDGQAHARCIISTTPQIANDQWFCWTAPFTDKAVVRTCGLTDNADTDTVIAVYEGCNVCPPGDGELVTCNDDRCVDPDTLSVGLQSLVAFDAVANQTYLVRIGNVMGGIRGTGSFEISSPPPANADCPGEGDCCEDTQSKACDDDTCCRTVCACDVFCCEVDWDLECATQGFVDQVTGKTSTCGAQLLCESTCDTCGSPTSGECCEANGSRSCSDDLCCNAVCDRDPYCCEVEWDDQCVENNQRVLGADAARLCPALCNCGDPAAGDCCDPAGTGSVGCENVECCTTVCEDDGFCCDNTWDSNCVVGVNDHPGALVLCRDLCGCPHSCGDMNGDVVVDLRDVAEFQRCFAPLPQPWDECKCADLNLNGSVDLVDHSILSDLIGVGSSNSSPNCP